MPTRSFSNECHMDKQRRSFEVIRGDVGNAAGQLNDRSLLEQDVGRLRCGRVSGYRGVLHVRYAFGCVGHARFLINLTRKASARFVDAVVKECLGPHHHARAVETREGERFEPGRKGAFRRQAKTTTVSTVEREATNQFADSQEDGKAFMVTPDGGTSTYFYSMAGGLVLVSFEAGEEVDVEGVSDIKAETSLRAQIATPTSSATTGLSLPPLPLCPNPIEAEIYPPGAQEGDGADMKCEPVAASAQAASEHSPTATITAIRSPSDRLQVVKLPQLNPEMVAEHVHFPGEQSDREGHGAVTAPTPAPMTPEMCSATEELQLSPDLQHFHPEATGRQSNTCPDSHETDSVHSNFSFTLDTPPAFWELSMVPTYPMEGIWELQCESGAVHSHAPKRFNRRPMCFHRERNMCSTRGAPADRPPKRRVRNALAQGKHSKPAPLGR